MKHGMRRNNGPRIIHFSLSFLDVPNIVIFHLLVSFIDYKWCVRKHSIETINFITLFGIYIHNTKYNALCVSVSHIFVLDIPPHYLFSMMRTNTHSSVQTKKKYTNICQRLRMR